MVLTGILLAACDQADRFGTRAVTYNKEAEAAKDQGLVLNIIRAAYRRPLQFTDVTTISGQATASVTGGLSLVFGPHQSGSASTFTPGTTFSGGPTFSVVTLNTKEFYEGILTPIPMTTIDYYSSLGFPRALLLTLTINEIDISRPDASEAIYNPGTSGDRAQFQTILTDLLDRGMMTEKVPGSKAIGPPLVEADLRDSRGIAALDTQKLALSGHPLGKPGSDLSAEEWSSLHRRGVQFYYRIEKDDTSARFCFKRNSAKVGAFIGHTGIRMQESFVCGVRPSSSAARRRTPGQYTFRTAETQDASGITVKTRSVEGIIYFLGEIARSNLKLTDDKNPLKAVVHEESGSEDTAFSIGTDQFAPGISANYDGQTYFVPIDPKGHDRSGQVLEFLAELLALNSSAKDLPAPNIIPLISR